jgi:hypothetical protein
MAEWTRTLEWWQMIDRKDAILAAREVAEEGGILTFVGPEGFGHVEALSFACRVLKRRGWLCHDLSTHGPSSTSDFLIDGLESAFPTQPGGLSHRGQVGQMSLRLLREHCQRIFDADGARRHCLVIPYLDRSGPVEYGEARALEAVAGDRLLVVATLVHPESAAGFSDDAVVQLGGFTRLHVETCLKRDNRLTDAQVEAVRPGLGGLEVEDDGIVPVAAYAWLQATWRDLQ